MPTTHASFPMPDQFPHIFFHVALEALPEVNYDDLVYLSQLVRAQHREGSYVALVDAVRKIQWMKLSIMDAIAIDATLAAQFTGDPDVILNDPVGQIRHAKAVLEFISHGKAALDSLAVFVNDLLKLGFNGGERDVRRRPFKTKLASSDPSLGSFLNAESDWLQLNNPASTSIVSARDEWLHRGFPDLALMWPPSEVGVLPIPKELAATVKSGATSSTHYSTQQFGQYHFVRAVQILQIIVALAISVEAARMSPPLKRPENAQQRVSAVKFIATKEIQAKSMQLGPFSMPQ
jgi:hypothetical protein